MSIYMTVHPLKHWNEFS